MSIILSEILPPAEELFSKEDWKNIEEHVEYWVAQGLLESEEKG